MDMSQSMNSSPNEPVDLKNDLIPELKAISSSESKFSSLTLLIVTVIIFFSAQIISLKWQEILILICVLLFHELGHLVAMKLLKYNDVKMFFIPFLGAAVSGKNRNDTAVKSCMVSLMGPFPGIILGVLLYILFLLTKNYYVFKTAQVMLLLNAFNFLPIMPLDGGRYIDVLFVNRRYFRFLFAFAGAAIFLFLAVSGKDIILGLIGVFSVFAAFSKLKLHGLSSDLKARGIAASSVNELLEDEGSLQTVIGELRSRYPRLFQPKLISRGIFNQLTVIVDTIKFVPARLWAKVLLLAAYVILVSASIIVSVLFLAANYREVARGEEIDGKKYLVVERHLFGRKKTECRIDSALCFDGKGTAFAPDGKISDVFYYTKGYRTGEWQVFDTAGNVIEKRVYDKGRLVSESKLENGAWRAYSVEDMPFLRKCSEEIQRLSQPFKSNHNYF